MGGAMREVLEPSWLCALPGVPKLNLGHLLQTQNTGWKGGEGEGEVDWATLPLLTLRVQGQSIRATPPPGAPGFPWIEPSCWLRLPVIFTCEDALSSLQESTHPKPP